MWKCVCVTHTQIQGCLSASVAVTLLAGLMVSILFIRSLASGVTVSHSGEGNCSRDDIPKHLYSQNMHLKPTYHFYILHYIFSFLGTESSTLDSPTTKQYLLLPLTFFQTSVKAETLTSIKCIINRFHIMELNVKILRCYKLLKLCYSNTIILNWAN